MKAIRKTLKWLVEQIAEEAAAPERAAKEKEAEANAAASRAAAAAELAAERAALIAEAKTRTWTEDEDRMLRDFVQYYGCYNWTLAGNLLFNKKVSAYQCKARCEPFETNVVRAIRS